MKPLSRLKNQSSKLNFPIRDKISFSVMPVAHGGRSCLWALYRYKERLLS